MLKILDKIIYREETTWVRNMPRRHMSREEFADIDNACRPFVDGKDITLLNGPEIQEAVQNSPLSKEYADKIANAMSDSDSLAWTEKYRQDVELIYKFIQLGKAIEKYGYTVFHPVVHMAIRKSTHTKAMTILGTSFEYSARGGEYLGQVIEYKFRKAIGIDAIHPKYVHQKRSFGGDGKAFDKMCFMLAQDYADYLRGTHFPLMNSYRTKVRRRPINRFRRIFIWADESENRGIQWFMGLPIIWAWFIYWVFSLFTK